MFIRILYLGTKICRIKLRSYCIIGHILGWCTCCVLEIVSLGEEVALDTTEDVATPDVFNGWIGSKIGVFISVLNSQSINLIALCNIYNILEFSEEHNHVNFTIYIVQEMVSLFPIIKIDLILQLTHDIFFFFFVTIHTWYLWFSLTL